MAVFPLTVIDTISLSALLFQQYKKLQRITVSHSTDTSDRPFKDSLGFSCAISLFQSIRTISTNTCTCTLANAHKFVKKIPLKSIESHFTSHNHWG